MLIFELPENCIVPRRVAAKTLEERPQETNPHRLIVMKNINIQYNKKSQPVTKKMTNFPYMILVLLVQSIDQLFVSLVAPLVSVNPTFYQQ